MGFPTGGERLIGRAREQEQERTLEQEQERT